MDDSDAAALGRFLTLSDTAEILAITPAEALELVRSNELPAIRIGSSHLWRVERVILESYIEAKYEEARRLSLWEQSDFGNIPEISGGRVMRPRSHPSDSPR
ncbi:helix-turn-helix domain-containing protein [Cryobacterium psychrophilum]|uniref:DNA-binding protein n=1 Tax=Cryobacterium psychrophilum TaxID=41988 RepID=A0A4Y8KJ32_9MICO|nr:helix-turn-helix domain-containing protein [Cryobacterium psychrophilum]TDW30749.1 helix-turn-helix protein [Cryobacterium psychrophilum]TFD75847.1 DNA-binding protein [Cryobacterium psychrophilum]